MIKFFIIAAVMWVVLILGLNNAGAQTTYNNIEVKNYAKAAQVTLDTNGMVKAVYYRNDSIPTITGTVIDWTKGNILKKTIAATTTFTFSNTTMGSITIIITSTSGATVINWPGSVIWSNGSAPLQTANKTDIYTFISNGGGSFYGAVVQNY